MRLQEFHDCVAHEFGAAHGAFIVSSHVLSTLGGTPAELLDRGVTPREVWWALCEDFQVPEDRRLGPDRGNDAH
ncbi:DUF3046 domain-containing protein [Corynebacterium sp. 13CS0277]|uniref:DUF3046 domain-containing protein n=1 Tax=Corynebacterium sp. 13CS0277 TaxID=2071994 RepID=UPI000D02912D|nr:DUF3046 domain-containing protein [Corynebacterium sp. 13CS0277]PRQ10544.1 DUF3046 domain-containing protein [Corynebacterium sp. 13CS0277]